MEDYSRMAPGGTSTSTGHSNKMEGGERKRERLSERARDSARPHCSFRWLFDVGQNVAHEPISYYYGQVVIGGPLKAYWAKGESLGHDTCCGISPRDHKYI